MFSRKDYLDGKCTHREYYAQFVNSQQKSAILSRIGKDRLEKSTCEHFNDIPLKEWDSIYCPISSSKMKECGDYITNAGRICIIKEAATQILEERACKAN